MELCSISIEFGEGWAGDAEKYPIINPFNYGANTFGSHNVIGRIGADSIDAS